MGKRLVCVAGLLSLAVGIGAAQQSGELIDIYAVRVKPEKRMEFEAAIKRFADANRRNAGDNWIAFSPLYGGEQTTVYFASARENLAAVDTAMEAFDKAVAKSVGAANVQKVFHDYSANLTSERGEVRLRRPDLSCNFPDTAEGRNRLIAGTRFLRTTMVRAKPGMAPAVEDIWKKIRSAMETEGAKHPVGVTQATTGPGGVFYFTAYGTSLGDLEAQRLDLAKTLGEEAYRSLEKEISEAVADMRVDIYRMAPNLSNPPAEFMSYAPDFWKPKTAVAATKASSPVAASSQ